MSDPVEAAAPSPQPLTRAELDHAKCACGTPACSSATADIVVVSQQCHPGAPSRALYAPSRGVLYLVCSVCGVGAAHVQVAGSLPA